MSVSDIVGGVISFVSAAFLFDSAELFEAFDEFVFFEFAVLLVEVFASFPQADKITASIIGIIINFIFFLLYLSIYFRVF